MRDLKVSIFLLFSCGFFAQNVAAATKGFFVRGDVDETGSISVSDAILILRYLFLADSRLVDVPCHEAADVDDNGKINISDAAFLLNALFRGGPPPPPPFPGCGADPTSDRLDCLRNERCFPTFWGVDIEGDGVFYVVDRSKNVWGRGELDITKKEMVANIAGFSMEVQFGIVLFSTETSSFPGSTQAAGADTETKIQAINFVNSFSGVDSLDSCVRDALFTALQMAQGSSAKKKVLFYVGRGDGTCQGEDESAYLEETLRRVTQLNDGAVTIHTLGILKPKALNEAFLRDLAAKNGGTYTRIETS